MPLERCSETTCFGCAACAAGCPVQAIRMVPREGGFLYPEIDADRCVHCGRCDAVCPIGKSDTLVRKPQRTLAVWSKTSVRSDSTSGGAFTELATSVLNRGGAVCGAALFLSEYKVRHVCAETEADLAPLRKSKYVQSETLYALRKALTILKQKRPVLFVGTPCQVAGYRLLTQRFGDIALSCDLVCGSVPAPGVFEKYLKELEAKAHAKVVEYDFRDKSAGWNFPRAHITYASGKQTKTPIRCDVHYAAFAHKLGCRATCATCPFARQERTGDFTIADCWRVASYNGSFDDNHGTSLLLVQSKAGEALLDDVQQQNTARLLPYDLSHATKCNIPLHRTFPESSHRTDFLKRIDTGEAPTDVIKSFLGTHWQLKPTLIFWIKRLGWFYFRKHQ